MVKLTFLSRCGQLVPLEESDKRGIGDCVIPISANCVRMAKVLVALHALTSVIHMRLRCGKCHEGNRSYCKDEQHDTIRFFQMLTLHKPGNQTKRHGAAHGHTKQAVAFRGDVQKCNFARLYDSMDYEMTAEKETKHDDKEALPTD